MIAIIEISIKENKTHLKDLLQVSQVKGRFKVCDALWAVNVDWCLNVLLHWLQLNTCALWLAKCLRSA